MRTVLLIDGGHLRASAKAAGIEYNVDLIRTFANSCSVPEEYLLRILYYDAPQFRGTVELPVTGQKKNFSASDAWLTDLAKLERFAVRRGTIGFRGWKPKRALDPGGQLSDDDFTPLFEQKGVDMRIGLDIATYSERRLVDRIILVSGDTDMIPAMKHARKAGLEVCVVQFPPPSRAIHDLLLTHADLVRTVGWPVLQVG